MNVHALQKRFQRPLPPPSDGACLFPILPIRSVTNPLPPSALEVIFRVLASATGTHPLRPRVKVCRLPCAVRLPKLAVYRVSGREVAEASQPLKLPPPVLFLR